jgi:hypothetical protein
MKTETANKRHWDPELAKELEASLSLLVEEAPGICNPVGCSYDSLGDYKVSFKCEPSASVANSGFFEFDPVASRLRIWPSSPYRGVPYDVISFLKKKFPNAIYDYRSTDDRTHTFRNVKKMIFSGSI